MVEATSEVSGGRLPKGLEVLDRGDVTAKLEIGQILFATSELGRLLTDVEMQVEDRQRELVAEVAGTQPEVVTAVSTALEKKRIAGNNEQKARRQESELRRKEKRLIKLNTLTGMVREGGSDVVQEKRPTFEAGVGQIEDALSISISETTSGINEASGRMGAAREAKRAVSYRGVVAAEVGKLPQHLRSQQQLHNVEQALGLMDELQETLPQYQAGLVAVAERIISQAREDRPLKEGVFLESAVLEKLQAVADHSETKLARRIDGVVGSKVLGRKEGRFTALVNGVQERREISVQDTAEGIIDEIKASLTEGDYSREAVIHAADEMRVLVEKPGFLKKPVGDEYLTSSGLQAYEQVHQDEVIDPIRKVAFNAVGRISVENALGCSVVIAREGEARKIDFELKSPEGQSEETPLFDKFTQCQAVELELRRRLQMTVPTDIASVRSLAEAMRMNDELRRSMLKLADSRINGILVAEGVRSGAIKTTLGEIGVRVGETAIIAGTIAGVTYLGTGHFLESGRDVLASASQHAAQVLEAARQAPDQIAEIWAQMSGVTLEQAKQTLTTIDLSSLEGGIQSHATDAIVNISTQMSTQAERLAGNFEALAQQAKQVEQLRTLMETANQQAATIQASGVTEAAKQVVLAKLTAAVGTTAGLVSVGATMTEYGRRMVGKPVRRIGDVGRRIINSIKASF